MSFTGTDLILLIIAVAVSALCSGLEIAFVSSIKLYIELERNRGAIWARLVSVMLKRPARVIGALLVGNNLALVLYGLLMAKLLQPWLLGFGYGAAFVLVAQTVLSTWYKSITTTKYRHGVQDGKWPSFNKRFWQRNYYEHIIPTERAH